jgi:hypothetical protein
MHMRLFGIMLACGALMLAATPAAFATQQTSTPAAEPAAEGTPGIDLNAPTGYYLWHNDDGFHLRTHGPATEHNFDAILHTNGTFENVDSPKLEDGDRVDLGDGGQTLILHFHTYDLTDGVNFTIRGGERLHLDLKLDGKPAATDQIFIGAAAHNPKHNPFTLRI